MPKIIAKVCNYEPIRGINTACAYIFQSEKKQNENQHPHFMATNNTKNKKQFTFHAIPNIRLQVQSNTKIRHSPL